MILLLARKPAPEPADEKTRNRVGICNIYKAALGKGDRITLEQAIAILRAGW